MGQSARTRVDSRLGSNEPWKRIERAKNLETAAFALSPVSPCHYAMGKLKVAYGSSSCNSLYLLRLGW
uniref:Uncharacterized protein n=1 Tax=Vespula pensylvanica TaxID=30213 RepID=A0A834KHL2_VESPE|nr:hypothetical protein H0235_014419 [Vespula pensylvanica]